MVEACEYEYDLVVVGSGGGGMTAALVANHYGMSVLVLEKTGFFGGSTARSGGAIWIPNNHLMLEEGVDDSFENAQEYMKQTVGERVSQELQDAYLTHAPRMVEWLQEHTCVEFQRTPGYADYYPERPGGVVASRSLEPVPFNGRLLKKDRKKLRKPMAEAPFGLAFTSSEYQKLGMMTSTWEGKKVALSAVLRWLGNLLRGKLLLTMGQGLSGRLRFALIEAKITLWLEAPFQDLIIENKRVVGVTAQKEGRTIQIPAKYGVILAAGGFPHNLEMRRKYQSEPVSTEWTVASDGNTGDGIQAGKLHGAAVDLMDDAWWGPSSCPPGEEPFFHVGERAYPGGIIVNSRGQRYVNESASYIDVVHRMYQEHTETNPHIPSYFIFDQRFRNKYIFGTSFPRIPFPKRYFGQGYVLRASTIAELSGKIGIQERNLIETIKRFNQFAVDGRDLDFARGESAYDNYYGDPTVKPNPNLAPIEIAPFYAVKMWPGDLGTKGGLLTDTRARVLRADGSVINGLYAVGNNMASVMGNSYPGAGATIGPAMTFGYLAALSAAGVERQGAA